MKQLSLFDIQASNFNSARIAREVRKIFKVPLGDSFEQLDACSKKVQKYNDYEREFLAQVSIMLIKGDDITEKQANFIRALSKK